MAAEAHSTQQQTPPASGCDARPQNVPFPCLVRASWSPLLEPIKSHYAKRNPGPAYHRQRDLPVHRRTECLRSTEVIRWSRACKCLSTEDRRAGASIVHLRPVWQRYSLRRVNLDVLRVQPTTFPNNISVSTQSHFPKSIQTRNLSIPHGKRLILPTGPSMAMPSCVRTSEAADRAWDSLTPCPKGLRKRSLTSSSGLLPNPGLPGKLASSAAPTMQEHSGGWPLGSQKVSLQSSHGKA